MDLHVGDYEYANVSLTEYTRVIYEFGIMVNLKDTKTSQHNRKLVAITKLLDLINELSETKKVEWDQRLKNMTRPSNYRKSLLPGTDFGVHIGDIVLVADTPHQFHDSFGHIRKVNIDVKCKVIRVDKSSFRVQKFDSTIDETNYKIAKKSEKGYFIILWDDENLDIRSNCSCYKSAFTLKNVERLINVNTDPELYVNKLNLIRTN